MSVSTFINRVKFNDGEGLSYEDLNDLQQYWRATFLDLILGGQGSDYLSDTHMLETNLYVPHGAHANGYGSASQEVSNKAGMIMQWRTAGASDGMAPKLLCYWLEDDDLQTTLNAPDATNPRWDGVFVKLEDSESADSQDRDFKDGTTGVVTTSSTYKKYRTKLTKSYVAGTPAATNCSFPATPAGYVPWVYVMIPPGAGATPTVANIALVTMPCRRNTIDLMPMEMADGDKATKLDYTPGGGEIRTGVLFSDAVAEGNWLAKVGPHCRVTGMDVWGYRTSGTYTVTPKMYSAPTGANAVWTQSAIGGRSEAYPEPISGSADGCKYHDYRTLKNSTGVGNGYPLWGNGYPAGVRGWTELQAGNVGGSTKLGFNVIFSAGGYIYGGRLYYCY